jgi:hypothetical protein
MCLPDRHLLRELLVPLAVVAFVVVPGKVQAALGDRITASGQEFRAGTQRIWINGANTPWHHWNDFGGSFDPAWWDAEFKRLHENGINATRVWISCNGGVGINIDTNGQVSGATDAHWRDLDRLFEIARTNQVYIMATLMSFDHFRSNNRSSPRWRNWIGSDANIDSYVTNYLIPLANRYQTNPWLWSFDLMNEPDWVYQNAEDGRIPWARLQMYWAKAAVAVHAHSPILVTVGICMGPKYSSGIAGRNHDNVISDAALQAMVADPRARVDFYASHFYDWMEDTWGNAVRMAPGVYGMPVDKPNVIGEMPSKGTRSHTTSEDYEEASAHGWQGVMGWTSNGVDANGSLTQLGIATKAFYEHHRELVFPSAP